MKNSKTSKKEKKTSDQEVFEELEEKEDVEDPEGNEEGGLHPAELAEELRQPPEIEVPEREKDVEVQSKELPDPEEKEEEAKPSMITIQKSEAIKKAKQDRKRCPFGNLICEDCRLFRMFFASAPEKECALVYTAMRCL